MVLDYSSGVHYVLALLPEVVLSVWGMVVLLMGVGGNSSGRQSREWLGWLALAGLAGAAVANGWLYSGVSEADVGGMIAVDRYRLFANWVLLGGAALSLVVAIPYVAQQRLREGEFHALFLFAVVGMMFMASSRDLMLIFLGLELMSIGMYALVGFNRRDRRSAEAGLKYFLLGAFASAFLLFGIALVYGATGSVNVAVIAESVSAGSAIHAFLVPGVALLVIGFGFKVAAVPFHMWAPDVYEGAPTPVTAFMAAAVKAAAFIAFARVFIVGLHDVYPQWWAMLWWLAAVTMVVGNVIALVQSDVKRMLAYSSVAHAGYLLVALVVANGTAVAALMFYLLIYTVMTVGAFAVVISVASLGPRADSRIERFRGLGSKRPMLCVLMTVLLLSLAGFPGTAGFIAKYQLLLGAAEAQQWNLSVILVLTTVLSYWYYLRVAWYMWMKDAPLETSDDRSPEVTPMATRVVLVGSVALVILGGVFPGALLDLAANSADILAAVTSGSAATAGTP